MRQSGRTSLGPEELATAVAGTMQEYRFAPSRHLCELVDRHSLDLSKLDSLTAYRGQYIAMSKDGRLEHYVPMPSQHPALEFQDFAYSYAWVFSVYGTRYAFCKMFA